MLLPPKSDDVAGLFPNKLPEGLVELLFPKSPVLLFVLFPKRDVEPAGLLPNRPPVVFDAELLPNEEAPLVFEPTLLLPNSPPGAAGLFPNNPPEAPADVF